MIDFTKYTKFTFFYGNGTPFSQFYPCKFTNGYQTYNCTEQYMHYLKASTFGDFGTAARIMGESKPAVIKRYGREVADYDGEIWDKVCRKIVYKGNYYKFDQNETIRQSLFMTRYTLLAEAAANDLRWGTGLWESNPAIQDRSNWTGTNWLGEALTMVREDLWGKYNG